MARHLYFWIGFFAAALMVVPIAAGIMGAAEEELRRAAVLIFAVVAGLVIVMVGVLLFRDWILRKLLGRTEATLQEASASLVAGVSAASAGDRAAATEHAQAFVSQGLAWYTWTNFYRWVIATAVALLLAFGAFVGTVLLFEQNRKLGEQTETLRTQTTALETQTERLTEQTGFMQSQTELMQAQTDRLTEQTEAAAMQNEIMTLSMVSELRQQLLNTVEERNIAAIAADFPADGTLVVTPDGGDMTCGLRINPDYRLRTPPNTSTVAAIAELSRGKLLGERVRQALRFLREDSDDAVAFGALVVLDQINEPAPIKTRDFDGLFIADVTLGQAHNIRLTESWVEFLNCAECTVRVWSSVYGGEVLSRRLTVLDSFVGSPDAVRLNGRRLLTFSEPASGARGMSHQMTFQLENQTYPVVLSDTHLNTPCRALHHFGANNPFFIYEGENPGLMAVPPVAPSVPAPPDEN